MNTKEQTAAGLRLTFEKVGQVSYKEAWTQAHVYQNDIKKYFGTLKQACQELGILTTKIKNKIVHCAQCNKEIEISKYSLDDFDRYCNECLIERNNKSFYDKIEGLDYLVCPACGFRTMSLEAHFRGGNVTWKACKYSREEVEAKYGELRMFAPILDERAKQTRKKIGWYKDRETTIQRMSASGGKHCLGKTKENCEYVKRISETKKEGFASGKYDTRIYKISKEQLEATAIEDGVNLRITSTKLNIPIWITSRLCERYGLQISRKWKTQTYVLKTISEILKTDFVEEFQFKKSRFRFDGCYPDLKLLVESNGYQHYIYPNIYHRTKEMFEKNLLYDDLKKQEAEKQGYRLLTVKYSDDLSAKGLQDRLVQENVLL